jgi:DNA-binding SARP family transcriptional activator
MLEFTILGPLSVRGSEGDIDVRGHRIRPLLARLLVADGQRVSVDLLIDELWGDSATDRTPSTLQSHISTLRRLVGVDRLRFVDGAYELRLAEGELDATSAAVESSDGRRAFQAGELRKAATLLYRALDRWYGEPLEDFAGSAWAVLEVSRLKELHTATLEVLHDVLLAQGEAQEVAQRAEQAVVLDPLRERLTAQLMLALYRCGRQADALKAFGNLRHRLDEELGLEPTRELFELEASILQQARELDWVVSESASRSARSEILKSVKQIQFPQEPGSTFFVGRESERQLLRSALKSAQQTARPTSVLLGGEPGVGKTSLALTMAREAHDSGANVLYGHCDRDLGPPFQPWREVMGQLMSSPSPALDAVLQRFHPVLGPLGLVDPANTETTAPDVDAYVLFGAVIELLRVAADERDLVLVLDDFQDADAQSIQILRKILMDRHSFVVLVLVTFRDSEVARASPFATLLADLRRIDTTERIVLKGLNDLELFSLLELEAGHRLDDGAIPLRDTLLAETNGNPFFVGELLRHLVETGALVQGADGRWGTEPGAIYRELPASLSEVIGERVARLGPWAVHTLSVAAVVGRNFELDVLALSTGEDPLELLGQLEVAMGASLVIDLGSGHFSFTHALVDRALYNELGPTRRALVHAQVATALEDIRGGDPTRSAEIALHWMRATLPRDANKALAASKAAADHALNNLAPSEAMRWYQEALDLIDEQHVPDERQRCEVLTGLGDAQRQIGDPAHRSTLLSAARRAIDLDDSALLVRAVLSNTRGFFAEAGHIDAERISVLEHAAIRTTNERSRERARVLALLAAELTFSTDRLRRRELADEALEIARECGDSATLVQVLNLRTAAIQDPDTADEVLANTAEALLLAETLRNPLVEGLAAGWRYFAAWQSVVRSETDRTWNKMRDSALTLGQPTTSWFVAFMGAHRATVNGDFDEAVQLAEEALKLGTDTGQPDAFNIYGGQILRISRETDKAEDILPIVEGVVTTSLEDVTARAMLARLYCDLGRLNEAYTCIEYQAVDPGGVVRNVFWACSLSLIADTVADLEWVEPAFTLFELLDPYAEQWDWVGPTSNGPIARVVGRLANLLGNQIRADGCFQRALSMSETMGSPLYVAHTRLDWGRALNQYGRRHEAQAHLERASSLADRYGLTLVGRLATDAYAP